jgi:hypothetical protein
MQEMESVRFGKLRCVYAPIFHHHRQEGNISIIPESLLLLCHNSSLKPFPPSSRAVAFCNYKLICISSNCI